MKAAEVLLVISVHRDTTHQIVWNVSAMNMAQSDSHAILLLANANANIILLVINALNALQTYSIIRIVKSVVVILTVHRRLFQVVIKT